MKELIAKYCELFGEIYENREFLPDYLRERMFKDLTARYKKEFKYLVFAQDIKDGQEQFELDYKHNRYVPRAGFWRKNKIAKKLNKLFAKQFQAMLENLQKEIDGYKASESTSDETSSQKVDDSQEPQNALAPIATMPIRANQSEDSQLDE